MKTIIKSLKESFNTIKEKKGYFAVLFSAQFVFIIVLMFLFMSFSLKIGEKAQEVMTPLQNVTEDLTDIQQLQFLDQTQEITQAYNQLMKYSIGLLLLSFLVYVIFNGLSWDIANLMTNEKSPFLLYEIMFGISTFIFTFVVFLVASIFLRLLLVVGDQIWGGILGITLFAIVNYFIVISYALINKYDASQIPQFIKHTFKLGIKKFHILLPSYLIILATTILIIFIIYKLVYSPIWLLLIFLLLFIIIMSIGKIFFLTVVKNVDPGYKVEKKEKIDIKQN